MTATLSLDYADEHGNVHHESFPFVPVVLLIAKMTFWRQEILLSGCIFIQFYVHSFTDGE